MTSRTASPTGPADAHLAASLLDALVDAVEAAGESTASNTLIRRLGERVARSLVERGDGPSTTGPAAPGANIEVLAAQLLPGSRLLSTTDDEITVSLLASAPSEAPLSSMVEPPTRVRLVASALTCLFTDADEHTPPHVALRLVDGETCWVQTIKRHGSGETGLNSPLPSPLPRARERGVGSPLPRTGEGASSQRLGERASSEHSQELGELAASVAHGLNNLLGAVAGQSSQLLAAANEADAIALRVSGLRLIHQAALDGAGLAQRLLRASRGEPADGPGALELIDLGRVLVDAVELTRMRWHDETRHRGIIIEPAVEVSQPLLIRGVAADLREIVVNLILNAVDAMPSGGQLVLRGDLLDSVITVSCQDTGTGMTPEVRTRLFEPFFTTKGSAGTGVGMAILYGVVARHGGEVQVSSSVGGGTTVTLHLPAAQLTHGARLTPARAASSELADLGPVLQTLSVLVVEDDPSFRAVFARRLALDARRVEAVVDAESALLLLETGRWDLVCIDEGLPGASGRQLAAEIERRGLAGAVILVTGAATGPDDPSLISRGVDAVLPKPCSDVELARAVRTAAACLAARMATPA